MRRRRTGAPSRARCRGGVPPLSLQRRREGRYWLVGDVAQHAGPLLFVRLKGPESGKGAAGKWTDAATGEHGDLLDVIRESCGLLDFHDVADEARRFLSLPRPSRSRSRTRSPSADRIAGIGTAAVRHVAADFGHNRGSVFAQSRHYGFARNRKPALPPALLLSARRARRPTETWPAMIAAVTDLDGHLTGAHRTWLDPGGRRSARRRSTRRDGRWAISSATPSASAWRATSWRPAKASRPCCRCDASAHHADGRGALGRNHLAAILFPATLRRLYIARDDDPAGDGAVATLIDRAQRPGSRRSCCRQARRLQRGSPHARHRRASGGPCGCRSRRRTSPASWNWRRPERDERSAPAPVAHGSDR
jgi:hypothetical protein